MPQFPSCEPGTAVPSVGAVVRAHAPGVQGVQSAGGKCRKEDWLCDDRVCAVCAASLVPGTAGARYPAVQRGVVRDLGKDQTAAGKEWSSQGDLEGRRMATRPHRGK